MSGQEDGRLGSADRATREPSPASGLGPDGRVSTDAAHTPGPWSVGGEWPQIVAIYDANCVYIAHAETGIGRDWIARNPLGRDVAQANARLIAAAPDHALIGWAMCVACGRWEPWGDGRGEFCINGFCYATKLDEFGVPEMTDAMRAAIIRARGQ